MANLSSSDAGVVQDEDVDVGMMLMPVVTMMMMMT